MAKKKQEPIAPAISTIPLPDQETPLVIDLPDGQKLVVGNIPRGTVIEVATWRGTGRPDSRTNRLMLGVSSTEAPTTTPTSEPAPESASPRTSKSIVMSFRRFIDSLVVKTPRAKREKAVAEIDEMLAADSAKSIDSSIDHSDSKSKSGSRVAMALDDEGDIQSWLDDLMSSSTNEFLKSPTKVKKSANPQPRKKANRAKRAKRARKVSSKPRKPKTRAKKRSTKGR